MKREYYIGRGVGVIAFLFIVMPLYAQEAVTLQQCIEQALESNYSLKISRNRAQMSENSVNYSPFLPGISLSARQNQTINDVRTENSAGEVNKSSGDKANSYSAGAELNWRIFDGLNMFTTHSRLKELEAMGELTLRQNIEELIVEVCSLYYNVIVRSYRVEAAKYTIELSNERYEDALFRSEIGRSSGLEAKQAVVDLQADSSAYFKQVELLKSAYISLNQVLNIELQLQDYIQDTILMESMLMLPDLEQETVKKNTLLQMAGRNYRISELDLKSARSALFPTIDFNGGYNYSRSENSSTVRTDGPHWGFSLNLPIFNKMQSRTNIRNAKLERENAGYSLMETERLVLGDLAQLYNSYQNNLLIVSYERQSADIAQLNMNEAMVMFKLGTLSGIDFRNFQKSYTDAVDRKLAAMFQAKMSELSLRLISGNIGEVFHYE